MATQWFNPDTISCAFRLSDSFKYCIVLDMDLCPRQDLIWPGCLVSAQIAIAIECLKEWKCAFER